jgi:hypothetical protein
VNVYTDVWINVWQALRRVTGVGAQGHSAGCALRIAVRPRGGRLRGGRATHLASAWSVTRTCTSTSYLHKYGRSMVIWPKVKCVLVLWPKVKRY